MIEVEVNIGKKIAYAVEGNKVTFNDELTLNLEKMERDFPVCIDICIDSYGMVRTGLASEYAAQIEIPERQYTETEIPNPDYREAEGISEDGEADSPQDSMRNESPTIINRESVPFSLDRVTLKLYAI